MLLLSSLSLPVRRCLFEEIIMLKLLFHSYHFDPQFYLGLSVIAFFFTPYQMETTPADMAETDRGPGDGHWPLSDPEATQIIPKEYYKDRQGGLSWYNICMSDVRSYLKVLIPLKSPARSLYSQRQNDRPKSRGLFLLRRRSLKQQSQTARKPKWTTLPMRLHSH